MSLTSERFELGPRIGRGTSGDVHRAIDRMTGEMVAVKLVDLEDAEDEVEDIQREIATLVQINSRYVTKYLGSWMHEGSTRLAIAMEYMAGGSVADLLESAPLPEEAIAVVCRDLLMALDFKPRARPLQEVKTNQCTPNGGPVALNRNPTTSFLTATT